jgi:uncharacterized membrane protein (UPF0182 family)
MPETIDWPPRSRSPRRRGLLFLAAVVFVLLLGGGTALSYYVDALWFESLGYSDVFWKTLNVQAGVFSVFTLATFVVLYGAYMLVKPAHLGELTGIPIVINGQPIKLPVEPVLRLIAIGLAIVIAFITGADLMGNWSTFALYWSAPPSMGVVDPVFGRPLSFYFFTLPVWELVGGWVMTLAVMVCVVSAFFIVITGGGRILVGRSQDGRVMRAWRGLSFGFGVLLLSIAFRLYVGRFLRLFADHTIFAGITYTDAHVELTGMLVVAAALAIGAAMALWNATSTPRMRWLIAAVVPPAICYAVVGLISWYVSSFIVKPNELVRERPYIVHNIEMTRQAYGLHRVTEHPFPADTTVEAADIPHNQSTLQNIRLWDWRALQDTLRQIQEIRTYYDFPDIDIDRYTIDGQVRQVMLATRELNIDKLPESSRNWINEKLIYTHGYGVTMNPVNGFTSEGLPTLVLSNMPVQSVVPSIKVTRPEVYFGELTNTDVYVKTRQNEFNYPQGDTNNLTSYEGTGGVAVGGFFRRLLIALDRGDLAKLPFSDDVTAGSRLLMRRNIRERVQTIAPFLTFDPDPYIVITPDGKLSWIFDAFTTSDMYPYSRHFTLGHERLNYMRNSVKAVVDAYDGATTFYIFDAEDPLLAGYRAVFPRLFKDAASMPPALREHVRYPELLLKLQAAVYGLYHMTDPEVFYNREDLWTVANEVGLNEQNQQSTRPIEPNFVLMTLPGETATEFVEILPFTPANRNNLIGWIAGRSDAPNYGTTIVYNFPKTKLVDGPLQIEARIDQNAQLSGQLSLWNQQGSRVRRGGLLVIPIGRALLYAEGIYLQAEHSPMPELRLVVLALQDRLAYGPTFESALASLLSGSPSTLASTPAAQASSAPAAAAAPTPSREGGSAPSGPRDANALINEASRDLTDYQRLTAEGRLGEAGQKLDALKAVLNELNKKR